MKLHRIMAAAVAAGTLVAAPALAAGAEGYTSLDTGTVTDVTPAPGQTVTLKFTGFKPGSTVVINIFSDPVLLGTFTADANGTVEVPVLIPAGMEVGSHTIVATGVDAQGNPASMSIPVTVTSNAPTAADPNGGGGFLPRTGGDVAALVTVGGVLVVIGGASALAARRRLTESR
jgi:titin